ncbi:GntR family transcriptional regulator [Oricola indica]|uniref:GntR family transcriptional regulator n=1 Tax=Oricola indica TaxID=2872591 RepID=UPI003CCB8ECF
MQQSNSSDDDRGTLMGAPGEKLADALYASIRDEVIFGTDVGAGERIYPKGLSERFNVSPTPVREALMRLAAEGYIESIPRRGFRIRKPSSQQVRDLWEVRLGLEVNAGELAIMRMKAGEIVADVVKPLLQIVEQADSDWERLSGRQQIELNTKFHSRIVELSGNAMLQSIYQSIQLQYVSSRVRHGVDSWRERREIEIREHRAIVAALADRDEDAYRIAAKSHVLRSLNDALNDVTAL